MSSTVFKLLRKARKKVDELEFNEKVDELMELLEDKGICKEESKKTNPIMVVLAIVGAIAAVAAIAATVFYFLIPEDSEYFEDFDEDEYDDDDLEGDE